METERYRVIKRQAQTTQSAEQGCPWDPVSGPGQSSSTPSCTGLFPEQSLGEAVRSFQLLLQKKVPQLSCEKNGTKYVRNNSKGKIQPAFAQTGGFAPTYSV